jgi:hypothetical protein
MRRIATAVVVMAVLTVPLGAQGRRGWGGGDRAQGIPPGHMPPAGECRVWYDGRPPGRQPGPMSCREAERIASRDRNARVIYGARADSGYPDRYPDRYPDNSRRGPYDNRYPSGGYGVNSAPYQNGYRDGLEKGHEDARDRDSYDPVRHSRYRSADRGYDRRYGSKDQYKLVYRDGFEAGYGAGYRESRGDRRGGTGRLPWPF